MPDIKLYSLAEIELWHDQFEFVRKQILMGQDRLRKNYGIDRLNLNQQEEASILFVDNEIASFSFLYHKIDWKNAARVLNRFWLAPKYRGNKWTTIHPITKVLNIGISDLMIDHQLSAAKKKKYDYIFVSRSQPALAWQRNFLKKNKLWAGTGDILYKTVNGNLLDSWQVCVWLNIGNLETQFPLESIHIETYKEMIGKK